MSTLQNDPNPTALRIPDEKGAPVNRIRNAWHAWHVCDEIYKADKKRAKKRARIFKAYRRFPPSEYSTLFKKDLQDSSNVCFGMLANIVDNSISSFYDMLTERGMVATIKTKYGKPNERQIYSEFISMAFDKVIREWDDFLLNAEQDLLDMHLYGKGIQIREDEEGCMTEHISADDCIFPDGTKVSLTNFDLVVIKRTYQMHELWEKLESGGAEERGWNKKAVLNAMRYQRLEWSKKYKDENEWNKAVSDGDIVLTSHLKEYVECWLLFIREYDNSISKYIVLRNYNTPLSLTRTAQAQVDSEDSKRKVIEREGFLYEKTNFAKKISPDVLNVFMDCAGTGLFHSIPSLAEKVFVQCRQYDFTMNAVMDAVRLNMTLILKGTTSDAALKLKNMVFGPFMFMPTDADFIQQRVELPTTEATQTTQFMMLDLFRGIGEYRVNEQNQNGTPQTATQRQLDAAEAAKLSGTQLKRYNGQHSLYYRGLYERMINLKEGEKDYEHYKKFVDCLKAWGVPSEAWKMDNIESINSMALIGAGSTSFKLMAAEKTVALLNVSPKGQGQANAIADGLAALHGRDNVERYMPRMKPDLSFNERLAHYENMLLSSPFTNPSDVKVQPDDDDGYHLDVHLTDMERTIALVNEKMQTGQITDFYAEQAAYKLLNQGGHCLAHIENLKRDEGKQDVLKAAEGRLNSIQRIADQMSKDMQAMKDQKKEEFDPANDPDIAKEIAMSQIQINTAEQLASIKMAAVADKHAQAMEIGKEKAAQEIAITRTKSASQKPKPKPKQ